jgi:hypothetical protein
MSGHAVGIARIEAAPRAADRCVEVARVDPVGNLRSGGQRRTAVLTVGSRPRRGPPLTIPRRLAVLPRAAGATGALGSVALRTPVLPLGALPRRPITLRTAVTPLATRAGPVTARSVALRTTVLPLRAVTRGPATLRTTLLPLTPRRRGALRTVPRRPLTPRRTIPLRPVALRATVLPLRTVPRGAITPRSAGSLRTVPLRTTVLPVASRGRRSLGPVPLRTAVLPTALFVTRRRSGATAPAGVAVTLRARTTTAARPAGRPAGASTRTPSGGTGSTTRSAGSTARRTGPARAAGVASGSGAAAVARSVGAASRGSHDWGYLFDRVRHQEAEIAY